MPIHQIIILLRPYYHRSGTEAGCDEAGRGCLAGPVFAAAVVLSPSFYHPLLNDSKKLSESKRKELRQVIEAEAICWSVKMVDTLEIDRINILQASFKAMNLAIQDLLQKPSLLLIDGHMFFDEHNIPYHCIIKGDGKFASIAAASILAKTHRDEYMERIHHDYPAYGWAQNKGYPTIKHRKAIFEFGRCPHHRRSFQVQIQNTLFSDSLPYP